MFDQDTTKADFQSAWPGGYVENFSHYPEDAEAQVASVLNPYTSYCLEIGPGGGLWTTRYLSKMFGFVHCLDVIPKPPALNLPNVIYYEVGNHDFTCSPIADNSMDFVFSFGVFCHLSYDACRAYLHSIYRVLKSGAHAMIAFANWQRHPGAPKDEAQKRWANERRDPGTCWFYCDADMAEEMVLGAGFMNFRDALPEFRDTIATFTKPH